MSITNYNKMFDKNDEVTNVTEPTVDETVDEEVTNVTEPTVDETVADEVTNETEPTVDDTTPEQAPAKIGVVTDCEKLNVRNNPSLTAEILLVISKGTEVEIVNENDTFYFVRKDDATEGFCGWCMKKYISIK